MCDVLQIPRSTYYYKAKERENNDDIITKLIVQIFKDSRNIYGQRKSYIINLVIKYQDDVLVVL